MQSNFNSSLQSWGMDDELTISQAMLDAVRRAIWERTRDRRFLLLERWFRHSDLPQPHTQLSIELVATTVDIKSPDGEPVSPEAIAAEFVDLIQSEYSDLLELAERGTLPQPENIDDALETHPALVGSGILDAQQQATQEVGD